RLRAGHRGRGEHRRERGRDHAAPRARDRPADRAGQRRSGVFHLGNTHAGGPVKDPAGTATGPDTVVLAAATPERAMPYRDLGLTTEEYQRIRDLLGRRPTDPE